ncbi:MAG: glycosyltransferase [Pseudomonadota bacterium]
MTKPTWALCVATLNRLDALKICVECAAAQSRPPKEIIIVDASDDWERNREVIEQSLKKTGLPLVYLKARKRSLCVQRNQGADASNSDILFFLDDDSFMYPDCAEAIMKVYEKDHEQKIACVAAKSVPLSPLENSVSDLPTRQTRNNTQSRSPSSFVSRWLKRFVRREILLRNLQNRFVPYDRVGYGPTKTIPVELASADIQSVTLVSGFRITVRRRIAMIERSDENLLAYCPKEDLDSSYRFLRHGINVMARNAHLYHHEALSGRLKGRQVAELSALNMAYFIRAHSTKPLAHLAAYYFWSLRVLLAAVLLEAVGRRWTFPTARGTVIAIGKSVTVFRRPRAELSPWYETVQSLILKRQG